MIGALVIESLALAFRVLVTDAIDESAARFYEHFGLTRLTASAPCRLVLDLAPLLAQP